MTRVNINALKSRIVIIKCFVYTSLYQNLLPLITSFFFVILIMLGKLYEDAIDKSTRFIILFL